ncbi:MAG: molybdopterin molybdotransferase MoeA [Chitinophagaceae bacterium]
MMDFITVSKAESIIQSNIKDFGEEKISFENSLGRILAESLYADRDLPPFNRPTVDGIAILFNSFKNKIYKFKVKATQAAGEDPVRVEAEDECIEIMTGAALHNSVDTVIRYEDISIKDGVATINISKIKKGQNIHFQGKDKRAGDLVAKSNQIITPALIGLAASIGKTKLTVKKLPHILMITTGDEMVSANAKPAPYQLRRSNDSTIKAVLLRYKLKVDTLHLNDNYSLIKKELAGCLQEYDIILMSGGVSMGKFDYVPKALQELKVEKLFYKVKQRPGKPFWFGKHPEGAMVFAFPGNPVSAFMCLHRYFLPWLESSLSLQQQKIFAVLNKDVQFMHPLQYFAQVKLKMNDKGQLMAEPVEGNGSGDFSNLIDTDAFLELPLERDKFKKGEVFRVWKYNF